MTSTPRRFIRVIRNPEFAAWIAYDEVEQIWEAEVFVRTKNGVQYLEAEYPGAQPLEERLIREAFHFGHFSARPCSLERHFDPSMTHGVLALLRHWCRVHRVDLDALMRQAYPDETHRAAEDFDEIVAQAHWEGIEYPAPDDRYQTRRLLLALRAVGYNEIADAFIQAIRKLR